jgi:peptidoglycan/LPS O-acetylase OafA/YrhL
MPVEAYSRFRKLIREFAPNLEILQVRRNANGYIPTLDGWRAIAICGVILFHASTVTIAGHSLRPLQDLGEYGVQLFFAISGLLICGRLLDEEDRHGRISLRDFYVRRIFRIQPAAITFLLVAAYLAAFKSIPMPLGAWVSSLFGFRNLYAARTGLSPTTLYTNHFWSLGVEEQFYLFLPVPLVLVRKRRLAALGSITIAAMAWTSIAHRFNLVSEASSGRTDLQIAGLIFPAALALLLRSEGFREWLGRWVVPLAWIGVAAFFLSLDLMHHHFLALIVDIGFPTIILATVLRPRSIFSRLLEWAPFVYVGKISYSVYLWQQLFFVNLAAVHPASGILGKLQEFPMNIIAIAVCANASYFLIERPMTRFGRSFLRVDRPQAIGRTEAARDLVGA